MWGIYSYSLSIFIFAGLAVVIEVIFGFHLIKKHLKTVGLAVLTLLLLTPPGETAAYLMKTWVYNSKTSFYKEFLGAEVETYIFSFLVAIAISCAVITWTFYEDHGKTILIQSLKDIFKGTYAIWRKIE